MKQVDSIFKILALMMWMTVMSHQNVDGQSDVVNEGVAPAPACTIQALSGGAGPYCSLSALVGVNYSFCEANTIWYATSAIFYNSIDHPTT